MTTGLFLAITGVILNTSYSVVQLFSYSVIQFEVLSSQFLVIYLTYRFIWRTLGIQLFSYSVVSQSWLSIGKHHEFIAFRRSKAKP
jgi:cytochrome b subunit of formate dehydrogenase